MHAFTPKNGPPKLLKQNFSGTSKEQEKEPSHESPLKQKEDLSTSINQSNSVIHNFIVKKKKIVKRKKNNKGKFHPNFVKFSYNIDGEDMNQSVMTSSIPKLLNGSQSARESVENSRKLLRDSLFYS